MPAIRRYMVTQTREVEVDANHPEDAIQIAAAAFSNGQNSDNGVINGPPIVWGNTSSRIRPVEMTVKER